jgi:hypothetical protein
MAFGDGRHVSFEDVEVGTADGRGRDTDDGVVRVLKRGPRV